MKLLSIKYTTSKHDRYGNSYSAITVTDLRTGKTGIAKTSSSSNDRSAMFHLFGEDWTSVRDYCEEYDEVLGVRDFNHFVKGMPYAGCSYKDVAAWIKDAIGFTFDAKYAPGRVVLIQVDDMSFRTTVEQVRNGVGQHSIFNDAARSALELCQQSGFVGTTFHNNCQLSLL